jgi:FKBP-type peptidyl-prolyl cis-trans isomerase FklB
MIKGINQELYGPDTTKTISKDNLLAGFIAATLGKGGKMTMHRCSGLFVQTRMEAIKARSMEKIIRSQQTAGRSFPGCQQEETGCQSQHLADFNIRF